MLQAGGRVELVVGVVEAEFGEELSGGGVVGVVPGEEGSGVECREGVANGRLGGFERIAVPPVGRTDVKANLVNAFRRFIGAQATAADVIVIFQEEDGPVLDAVSSVVGKFFVEAFAHLVGRKLAASVNEPGDFVVAPQAEGEIKVVFVPMAKAEARGGDEVVHDVT